MEEAKIVQPALFALLQQNGIAATWRERHDEFDGELTLVLPDVKTRFFAEVKRELRAHHLPRLIEAAKQHRPFIVIAETIFPTLKQKLRDNQIAYLDTAGNIFAHTEGTYLWIDGHKPLLREKQIANRAFTKTGLKMVFYLLQNSEAINAPYRQLAKETGIALGNVKNVMDGLRQGGFLLDINRNQQKLQNKRALLDRWVTGYRETLKPTLLLGTYRFTDPAKFIHWDALPLEPGLEAWGGEPAAEYYTNYLKPSTLTLYTEQPKTAHMVKWRLVPDPNGNLTLYEKFWKEETIHAPNRGIAPPLLVYTDLLLTEDPRCMETAQMIYENFLINEFE